MPIKLFNKTPYDDKVLQRLLSFAHRAMGLKGTTAVKVICKQTMKCSGVAQYHARKASGSHGPECYLIIEDKLLTRSSELAPSQTCQRVIVNVGRHA
jgi:hypothetical protein